MKKIVILLILCFALKAIKSFLEYREMQTLYNLPPHKQQRYTLTDIEGMNWN